MLYGTEIEVFIEYNNKSKWKKKNKIFLSFFSQVASHFMKYVCECVNVCEKIHRDQV